MPPTYFPLSWENTGDQWRIRRLEMVWDDEEEFDNVAKNRYLVAQKLLHEGDYKREKNSLIGFGYGGWLRHSQGLTVLHPAVGRYREIAKRITACTENNTISVSKDSHIGAEWPIALMMPSKKKLNLSSIIATHSSKKDLRK
nr:hypothetical protein [Tanacetum cinerariifolium]